MLTSLSIPVVRATKKRVSSSFVSSRTRGDIRQSIMCFMYTAESALPHGDSIQPLFSFSSLPYTTLPPTTVTPLAMFHLITPNFVKFTSIFFYLYLLQNKQRTYLPAGTISCASWRAPMKDSSMESVAREFLTNSVSRLSLSTTATANWGKQFQSTMIILMYRLLHLTHPRTMINYLAAN